MPEIRCVVTNGKRMFTSTAILPGLPGQRQLKYNSPGDLAAELLWLGAEYGGSPWAEGVWFSEPKEKWYHRLLLSRQVSMTDAEKAAFMERWDGLIARHGLA